jgi:hypothetical protein
MTVQSKLEGWLGWHRVEGGSIAEHFGTLAALRE